MKKAKTMARKRPIVWSDCTRVANEADCDVSCVLRYVDGDPVTSRIERRIKEALGKLGFGELVKQSRAS